MMERVKRQQSLVLLACVIVCVTIFFYSSSNITEDTVSVPLHHEETLYDTETAVYSRTVKHVTKSLTELGTTPSTNNYMLFFNRVPKSGSEMLVLLITWLQGINGFKHIRLAGGRNGDDRRLSRLGQEEMIEDIKEQSKDIALPTSFDRHVYFTNFSSFGTQQPIYINLIRDPVDKMISRFYYADLKGRTRDPQMFEDCVELENEDCRLLRGHAYDLTIPYFCGHDLWCS
ncbi:hypothetical protein B566_EDAN001997 [Ephemera danica]|nr:hypothetical protein B566_EDAN001997 [Ephemera danica]